MRNNRFNDAPLKLLSEGEGSALIAVLVVTMILSVLITSILMGFLIQSRLIDRDHDRLQARYSAEAGIYHFLADSASSVIPQRDSLAVTLEDSSQVNLQLKPFGGYLLVSSTARVHNQTTTILAMVGEDTLSECNKAIVLGDVHSALTMAGTSKINGDILVGPLGTKQSEFKGELFKGEVDGSIKKDSVSPMPDYHTLFFKNELARDDSLISHAPKTVQAIDSDELDLTSGLPFKSHQVWYREGDLMLSSMKSTELPEFLTIVVTGDLTVKGGIHVGRFNRCLAGKSMTLTDSVGGEQALFYAKDSLKLGNNVRIGGQFIAQKKITIRNQSYLKYPTVLYLGGYTGQNTYKGTINIMDNSKVNGTVILPKTSETVTRDSTRITIGKDAIVRGTIYNSGKTELTGTVLGSVMTFQFYLYRSPTTYINWLLDSQIDQKKRPNPYILPLGFSKEKHYKLVTWQEGGL